MNRVETTDYDVESQVELEAVDEEGLVQVPLHDHATTLHSLRQLVQLLKEMD